MTGSKMLCAFADAKIVPKPRVPNTIVFSATRLFMKQILIGKSVVDLFRQATLADGFQLVFDFRVDHGFAVLGEANDVVEQHADIVSLVQVVAHTLA